MESAAPQSTRQDDADVIGGLSRLDRFLPVWIVIAMAVGLVLGRTIDGLDDALDAVKIGSVSLPSPSAYSS